MSWNAIVDDLSTNLDSHSNDGLSLSVNSERKRLWEDLKCKISLQPIAYDCCLYAIKRNFVREKWSFIVWM